MSLERECVKDTDLQLRKTAGQGIDAKFGGAPVLTDSRSSDISTFEVQLFRQLVPRVAIARASRH